LGNTVVKSKAGRNKVVGRIPRRREEHRELWIGGRCPSAIPAEREDGTAVDCHHVIWLDENDMLIGAVAVVVDEEDACVGEILREFSEEPFFGPPRLPTHVRVATPELAEAVRAEFGSELRIEVAPTPEVEEFARLYDRQLADDAAPTSYLDDEGTTPDIVAAFFRASCRLAEHAPWQLLHTHEYFLVSVPSEGLEDAVLVVTGSDFPPPGFMLFPSYELFAAAMGGDDTGGATQAVAPGADEAGCLVVALASASGVSPLMESQVEEHGWEQVGEDVFPIVHRMLGDGGFRPISVHDYRLATAVCEALCEVGDDELAGTDIDDPEAPDLVYVASNGIEIELEFPELLPSWEDLDVDDLEDEDESEAAVVASSAREVPAEVYQGLVELEYLSPRARGALSKGTPSPGGETWRLDLPADDVEHIAELLLAAARKKAGTTSFFESIEAKALNALRAPPLEADTVVELDRNQAASGTQRNRATPALYQLKVTLQGIRPPIWRRIEVPSDINLARLHYLVQSAMGWTDSHLHMFECEGVRFGVPDPEFDFEEMVDERSVRLGELLEAPKQRLDYVYDFGDDWNHRIVLEKIHPLPERKGGKGKFHPRCTAGRRACPPEDCGGEPGYAELLEVISNPRHPEHRDMKDWLGEHFDPERFEPGFDL
jgi:hypothetical protein